MDTDRVGAGKGKVGIWIGIWTGDGNVPSYLRIHEQARTDGSRVPLMLPAGKKDIAVFPRSDGCRDIPLAHDNAHPIPRAQSRGALQLTRGDQGGMRGRAAVCGRCWFLLTFTPGRLVPSIPSAIPPPVLEIAPGISRHWLNRSLGTLAFPHRLWWDRGPGLDWLESDGSPAVLLHFHAPATACLGGPNKSFETGRPGSEPGGAVGSSSLPALH
ncbi:hypothetical protein B0T26DRAFT_60852 [Lasiosphaeria miniovina]|uniref:Uncharacterized protein n=1 Tax=Lasiosphaeria miniovina TaxID=1954250 RepID=A0AA40BHA9_9PEZI|nr:uncharacterized protein B0T26DRAFT_60852 [Lasiosphaeria miniovina]KAK0734229.1 hypothetical protein B0T26DRAFT_60852 [Lasiosphaeria miniovina]